MKDITIGRNQQAKAQAIFANAQEIKAYTHENQYSGESSPAIGWHGQLWMPLEWERFSYSRLIDKGQCRYRFQIGNWCWYDFTSHT